MIQSLDLNATTCNLCELGKQLTSDLHFPIHRVDSSLHRLWSRGKEKVALVVICHCHASCWGLHFPICEVGRELIPHGDH